MKKLSLLIILLSLVACDRSIKVTSKTSTDVSNQFDLSGNLEGCTVNELHSTFSTITDKHLTVTRCPYSVTTTIYVESHGKSSKVVENTVVDEDTTGFGKFKKFFSKLEGN